MSYDHKYLFYPLKFLVILFQRLFYYIITKMQPVKKYYKRNLPHYHPDGSTFFVTFRTSGSLPLDLILKLKEEYKFNVDKLSQIKSLKERNDKYHLLKWSYFKNYDHYMDNSSKNIFLSNDLVAESIFHSILAMDQIKYDLICFCLMPNHVHIVLTPKDLDPNNSGKECLCSEEGNSAQLIKTQEWSDINVALHNCPATEMQTGSEINGTQHNSSLTEILRLLKGSTARECNKILNRTGKFWQHESYDNVIRSEADLNRIVMYVLNNPVSAKLTEEIGGWRWSYCKYL